MTRFLIVALFLSLPAFADEDAGVSEVAPVDAGVLVLQRADAGVLAVTPGDQTALDAPKDLVVAMYKQVKAGNFIQAVGILLVLLIALFRMFGKKIHALIPDTSWADKPFWFLLETKPGGWLLNFLFVTGGGLGSVWLAGENVTWDIFKSIVTISLTAAAIWGLVKDLWEWIQGLKAKKTEVPPAPGA